MLQRVFSLVATRDLLRGPAGVCRRWREAALDPAVWRHRSLNHTSGSSFVKAVLRAAPCLASLSLEYHLYDEGLEEASSSHCAVKRLELTVNVPPCGFGSERIAGAAARAVRRQIALGRLEALTVHMGVDSGAEFQDLYLAIVEAPVTKLRLEIEACRLIGPLVDNVSGEDGFGDEDALHAGMDAPAVMELRRDVEAPVPAVLPSTSPASLKQLQLIYYSRSIDEIIPLERLLELHASTLESVSAESYISDRVVELLSRCSALRGLRLLGYRDLTPLLECGQLRSLTLCVSAREAGPYLQRAIRLTKLTFSDKYTCVEEGILTLVAAVASSGRSALQELAVGRVASARHLSALPAALAGLHHLHTLRLCDQPRYDFLAALGDHAPALRLFIFAKSKVSSEELCREAPCYLQGLFWLVQRNRRLHVVGASVHHFCLNSAGCSCCETGLHVRSREAVKRSLFGHPEAAACDLDVHGGSSSSSSGEWLWVGEPYNEMPVDM